MSWTWIRFIDLDLLTFVVGDLLCPDDLDLDLGLVEINGAFGEGSHKACVHSEGGGPLVGAGWGKQRAGPSTNHEEG